MSYTSDMSATAAVNELNEQALERQLRRRLRAHGRKRAAHEAQARELTAELAELTREAETLWGAYGSVTKVAELTGVHRATVHRALAG